MKFPIAILRMRWPDQTVPNQRWSDADVKRIFESDNWYSVPSYWRAVTSGAFDLSGSRVFDVGIGSLNFSMDPGYKDASQLQRIAMQNRPGGHQNNRSDVVKAAIADAERLNIPGFDRNAFSGFIALYEQRDDMGYMPADAGNAGNLTLVVEESTLLAPTTAAFILHEVGHMLGFFDAFGRVNGMPVMYEDPFDVMAAQLFDNATRNPDFPAPPQPDPATTTIATYFSSFPPRIAAGARYLYEQGFAQSSAVRKLTDNFRSSGETVRLHSPTKTRFHPIVAVVPKRNATSANSTVDYEHFIEYRPRTPNNWDRALVSSSVTIHSAPFIPGLDRHHPCYETRIDLPIQGDSDVVVPNQGFFVRVLEVADDESYVVVRIAQQGSERGVTLGLLSNAHDSLVLKFQGVDDRVLLPPPCGFGRFAYGVYLQSTTIKLEAISYGYDSPIFTWTVNGAPVTGGLVQVTARVTRMTAGGPVTNNESISIDTEVDKHLLVLSTKGQAGNPELIVEVSVNESVSPGTALHRLARNEVVLEGEVKVYEDAYGQEVARCWYLTLLEAKSIPWKNKVQFPGPIEKLLKRLESDWQSPHLSARMPAFRRALDQLAKVEPDLAARLISGLDIRVKQQSIQAPLVR